jgi:predicted nuclease of predicted toxin-antitoxin system
VAQLRLKLDENLPREAVVLAQGRPQDVATVQEQHLGGASDAQLLIICRQEQRVLVTLDLDFADIRLYRPADGPGVIVLRPQLQSIPAIVHVLGQALAFAESHDPKGQLWVVEPGRIRVRA